MSELVWKKRNPKDASLGYSAEGDGVRYVAYRYESNWLLQVWATQTVGGVTVQVGQPREADVHESLTLCQAVAQAYENEPVHDGAMNRYTRAVRKGYAA